MSRFDTICAYADRQLPLYQDIAGDLHAHPEVGYHEVHACEVLTEQLKKEGFSVQTDIAGYPTGFTAVYQSGKPGPVLTFLAEYDALPGIGHACGHNLFGPTSLLAAAALKQVLPETGGEIRVYGTPAEEGGENGSAKASFVREGLFRDVDAALCVHPGSDYHSLTHEEMACAPMVVEFFGKASHAAASPQDGINALDAMILLFSSINAMRQQFTSDIRVHGVIDKGGDAPNIIPDYTKARFFIRAGTVKRMMNMVKKVENMVQGAALATGCTWKMEPAQRNLVENIIPTPSFDAVYRKNLELLGETVPQLPAVPLGSSDVGNVSQVIPVIQPMIAISDTPVAGHTVEKRDACLKQKGLASIGLGAKALALTALDLIEQPQLLESIIREHAAAVAAQQ